MIKSKDIELFQNLSQYDYYGIYYDFHNDYNCKNVILTADKTMVLVFQSILSKKKTVSLKFFDVLIEKLEFSNSLNEKYFTIDNLYRGKTENNNILKEFSNEQKGYFYLEFYEGQGIEFWSTGLIIDSENSGQVISLTNRADL